MAKWLQTLFSRRAEVRVTLSDAVEEQMRRASARARARLQADGRLEVELDAQREIRDRVREAA